MGSAIHPGFLFHFIKNPPVLERSSICWACEEGRELLLQDRQQGLRLFLRFPHSASTAERESPKFSTPQITNPTLRGVPHTWDLQYVFGTPRFNTPDDLATYDLCGKLWTNFILYGFALMLQEVSETRRHQTVCRRALRDQNLDRTLPSSPLDRDRQSDRLPLE